MADLAAPGGSSAGSSGPDFGDFLGATRPDLLKRARRLTFGHGDAEDLVQEALLKAWSTKHRPRQSWRSWLYVILRHVVIDWRRAGCLPHAEGEPWVKRWESIETAPGPALALDRFGERSYIPLPALETVRRGAKRRSGGDAMVARTAHTSK